MRQLSQVNKAFVAHWKTNCGRDSSPTCDLCDRPYTSKRALAEHIKTYCHLCETSFVTSQAFEQHYQHPAAHADNDCHTCNHFFEDERTKQEHMDVCDSADENTFCTICNKNFREPKDLQNHLSSPKHKGKNASCFVCPSKFRTPSGVALHLESGCKQLPLNRHHITAAVNSLNIAPKISLRHSVEGSLLATPRPLITYQAFESSFNGSAYQCPICPTMFRTLSSLEAHLNSPAHDEDEFKCPKCNTHFKLVSGLVQHLKSGSCGLSNLKDVERRFADMEAQLSRSLKL
ncbi:hypothetical protein M378DRAFT_167284 [Amanita muscaria Koide BX008]|uniref:C2H2-type domain-containing protein n=1 Tax=Amanita muscaria (strain Koide BX008) TaxID=946122 RepID=A0A0C2WXK9_AMAMK|nr:hypothetical protein M378DRAFT_167284 [Amanita muscaria Koide BX008]